MSFRKPDKQPWLPALFILGAGLLAGSPGCVVDDGLITNALSACAYVPTDYWNPQGTLTPACRAALEAVIPFDETSFAGAPAGYKDKITETFQAMIGYPLREPPESKILGVRPAGAGAIPLAHWAIFREYPTPNESLFSYVINSIDAIVYVPPDGSTQMHSALYTLSGGRREIHVFSGFWDPNDPGSSRWYPFRRAVVLAHEARHGDGFHHEYCATGSRKGEWECDPDLDGPRGFEITYQLFLLHGGALKPGEIAMTGAAICSNVQNTLLHPFPELKALFAPPFDCGGITADWVLEHEGIPATNP